MYIPPDFAFPEGATSELHALIEAHGFGVLIACDGASGRLEAAHLPFVLERDRGSRGTLLAHVARSNPIWSWFAPGREVLVIFQGPHGYVSPDWYAMDGLVPTWNYVAVHAYGVPRVVSDDARVRAHLEQLAATMEGALAPKPPWRPERLRDGALAALQRGIVMFEIEISRLQGKRKLNQNRSAADRAGVVRALEERAEPGGLALARTMRRHGLVEAEAVRDHEASGDGARGDGRPRR